MSEQQKEEEGTTVASGLSEQQEEEEGTMEASGLSPHSTATPPSPIITRRSRTESTSARALTLPPQLGKIKTFIRTKGHGFITPIEGGEDLFFHISDIEGEYIPRPGDEVRYRLCPIPPKEEKFQAVHVELINLTSQVHHKWDINPKDEQPGD